ncbi:glutamate formimidoyltransferase [Edaphobacter albus]|uniref:glutamate formimidoyltransferase n=1 Tax=Edaphobacter sp. 4G125 TaxID=2763071 RepID=UPI0016444AB1|nr:glutamate formimidoyltransferase [Edaphobacter sp. 4G125]QNI35438.1 glutamate formimidoyltransferase [Edaphobacter sp. 4G125]
MNSESIIECVPNFSEGTDPGKVSRIVQAMQVPGVSLLDWSLDTAHNRSVVTIAGQPEAVMESAVRGAGKAAELIDLTRQKGVHPRIGAADVVPFIPVRGATLAECALLARQAGLHIWRRYGVPIYFYGASAARPDRVHLEDVRRGQFEGLRDAVHRDASRRPDIGGPELHETAGASVVGSRSFLIAYNVHLRHPDITAARAIARDIRASNGGLHGVKALGVLANGRAQVSMNITDHLTTPMTKVYVRLKELAARHSAELDDSELIGLIPENSYEEGAEWITRIPNFTPELKVVERRLENPLDWPVAGV